MISGEILLYFSPTLYSYGCPKFYGRRRLSLLCPHTWSGAPNQDPPRAHLRRSCEQSRDRKLLKVMLGERGLEPPTPWSRTWGYRANFVATQSFKWCFNRLILAQSRQFWPNVNPRIATPAFVHGNILNVPSGPSRKEWRGGDSNPRGLCRDSGD